MIVRNIKKQRLFEQMSYHDVYCGFVLFFFKEIGYIFFEKMDDFSPQLGMRKTLEIRHFSMEFHSEGEF